MNIALIQHRIRGEMAADIEALAGSVRTACERGAEVVVCPVVPSLVASPSDAREAVLLQLEGCAEGTALLLPLRDTETASTELRATPLGETALLIADECLLPTVAQTLADLSPEAVIMRPLGHSELQAEAILEYGIGLSLSLSGLVLICECSGGAFAEPGHGGSAIVMLGEIVAEASDDEEILYATLEVPVAAPEPREHLPVLPPVLEQRIARHQGRKADMGYLADLS